MLELNGNHENVDAVVDDINGDSVGDTLKTNNKITYYCVKSIDCLKNDILFWLLFSQQKLNCLFLIFCS